MPLFNYQPVAMYDSPRYTATVIDLLRQGNQSGQIWGQAIQNIGNITAQTFHQLQQEREQKKQQALFADAISSYDPGDPTASYQKLVPRIGPKAAMEVIQGLQSFQKPELGPKDMESLLRAAKVTKDTVGEEAFARDYYPHLAQKVAPTLKASGLDVPPPELAGKYIDNWHAQLSPEKKSEAGFTLTPGETRYDASGKVIAQAEPKPKEEKQYQVTVPGPNGPITRLATKAEMEAGIREYQKPEKEAQGTWTQAEDADGNPVLLNSVTGAVKPYPAGVMPKPGATEGNRIAASRAALEASQEARDYIEKNRKVLGAVMGRYESLKAAAGAGDPTATKLMGMLTSYSSLQPQIHGFRSAQFVDKIERLINIKQDADALIGGIEGIDTAARVVVNRGRSPGATPVPDAIKGGSGTNDDPYHF